MVLSAKNQHYSGEIKMSTILNLAWSVMLYLLSACGATLLTILLFIPFILVAMILQKITEGLSRLWGEILGYRSWWIISSPGVFIHEAAHAIFCLIFHHEIKEVKFFEISDDSLGYVRHTYDPESLYQRIGNLFIGIAPVLVGITVIVFLSHSLMDIDVSLNLPDGKILFQQTAKDIALTFKNETLKLLSPELLFRWQTIVWFVCLTLIGSHITLSQPDLEGAGAGFEALIEGLLLYHLFMVKFIPLHKVLVFACGNFMLQGLYYMLLTAGLLIIILVTVYICRCLVRMLKFKQGSITSRLRAIFLGNAGENKNLRECSILVNEGDKAFEQKDYNTAFQKYKTSAVKYGIAYSQYALGMCYLCGFGTETDVQKAEHYLKSAAAQGFKQARFQLGKEYFEGKILGLDYVKAVKWLKKCTNDENPEVFQMLGECYESKLGVRENLRKAFYYYKKAYELNPDDPYSQMLMGECYFEGTGVKQDYDLAIKYLTPSKDSHDYSKIVLGKCFLYGKNDALTAARLFNQVTIEDFIEEADGLFDEALEKLSDEDAAELLQELEDINRNQNQIAPQTGNRPKFREEAYTLSDIETNVNISINAMSGNSKS